MSTRRETSDIRGYLQAEIMSVVWRLGEATVGQVRSELPEKDRPAYNTVQTVLNRLEDRGMLVRVKEGRAHLYTPSIEESDLVARSLGERLDEASPEARKSALLNLVDGLKPKEVDEIAARAKQIQARRGST